MLYHGLVQVPEDAIVGTATLTVRLADDSIYESTPTDIEVELIENKPPSNDDE